MTFALPIIAVVGSVIGAVGALQQGRAAQEQGRAIQAGNEAQALAEERIAEARANAAVQAAEIEAQSLNDQAIVQREQAQQERAVAAEETEDFRRQQSRLLAAQRAILGAAGVDPSQGTPLLLAQATAGEAARGIIRIREGGEITAGRIRQGASTLDRQAELERLRGTQAAELSRLQGAQNAQVARLRGSQAAQAGSDARRASFFRAGSSLLTGLSGFKTPTTGTTDFISLRSTGMSRV